MLEVPIVLVDLGPDDSGVTVHALDTECPFCKHKLRVTFKGSQSDAAFVVLAERLRDHSNSHREEN